MRGSAPASGAEAREAFAAAVVIPAKDAAATVGRAVASALAEPLAHEVIVVDDASGDETLAAARAQDDGTGRLKLIRSDQRLGPAGARNLAIEASTAPFIALLDADDFWLRGRLDALARYAPGHDLIADDPLMLDGEDVRRGAPLIGVAEPVGLSLADFLRHNISRPGRYRREWGFLKPVFRRAFLRRSGLTYDPDLLLGEDLVLYATALARGARFRLVPACGYAAVRRPGSLSERHSGPDLEALLKAATRLKGEVSAPQDRAALAAYLRHLKGKTRYRQLVDARRTGGLSAVLSLVLSGLDVLPAAVIGRLEQVRPPEWRPPREFGASRAGRAP